MISKFKKPYFILADQRDFSLVSTISISLYVFPLQVSITLDSLSCCSERSHVCILDNTFEKYFFRESAQWNSLLKLYWKHQFLGICNFSRTTDLGRPRGMPLSTSTVRFHPRNKTHENLNLVYLQSLVKRKHIGNYDRNSRLAKIWSTLITIRLSHSRWPYHAILSQHSVYDCVSVNLNSCDR